MTEYEGSQKKSLHDIIYEFSLSKIVQTIDMVNTHTSEKKVLNNRWQMLKPPSVNSRDYISDLQDKSECGVIICSKICSKSSKNRKKVNNGLFPIKKFDTDAIVLMKLIS